MKSAIIAFILAFAPYAYSGVPVLAGRNIKVMSAAEDTLRVAKPASIAEGEIVLLLAGTAEDGAGPCYTPPTDFTELFDYGDATVDTRIWAAWKYASASEPDSYFVPSSCGGDCFCIFAYRVTGASSVSANAFDPGSKSSINTGDSLSVTGITTYLDSSLAMCLYSFDGGDGDPFTVKPSTNTWLEEDQLVSGTSTTTDVGLFLAVKTMYAIGATGICKVDAAVADGQVGTIIAIHGTSTTDPDWGYKRVYQYPESLNVNGIRWDNTTFNYGGYNWVSIRRGGTGSDRYGLIRPQKDARTAGYTQDSAKIVIFDDDGNSDNIAGTDDTVFVNAHILRKFWGEDNKIAAIPSTGGSNWVYAESSSVAWSTAGAQGTADIGGIVDSFACDFAWENTANSRDSIVLTIRGDARVDSLFDFGVLFKMGTLKGSPAAGVFYPFADDTTANIGVGTGFAKRPFIVGWETAPVGATVIPMRRLRNEKMGK
jgi:hypothetical protein